MWFSDGPATGTSIKLKHHNKDINSFDLFKEILYQIFFSQTSVHFVNSSSLGNSLQINAYDMTYKATPARSLCYLNIPIKADNIIPKNNTTAAGVWRPLAAVGRVAGWLDWVALGQFDILGGRGSEITGIGTV